MVTISILIPYYNEIENFKHYKDMLFTIIDDIAIEYGILLEYLFVNDGSTDGSREYAEKYFQEYSKISVVNFKDNVVNRGLGYTLSRGFGFCKGDYIIVLDADLSYRPAHIRDMMDILIHNSDIDCISSSPYQFSRIEHINLPFIRKYGSIIFNKIYSKCIGHNITCATSMFRLYKSSVIRRMNIQSTGFDVNAEILSKLILNNYKVIEIPVDLYDRDYGKSKMNIIRETRFALKMLYIILLKRYFNKSKYPDFTYED